MLLTNLAVVYPCRSEGASDDLQPIRDGAVAWRGDRIVWVGEAARVPTDLEDLERVDGGGAIAVPGLVDCHTHLAFAGWRAEEFEQKIRGASYLDIARAGGGIRSTVTKTRAAPTDDLVARCLGHLAEMLDLGVTTVEAKTGYGLDLEQEIRLLEVYGRVAREAGQQLVPTLLAAHTIPAEYAGRQAEYVDLVVDRIIPAAARQGVARFCDVFVEDTAFTIPEGERILEAGKRAGLRPKIHADQITDTGGAALAARVGAASADHLERSNDAGLRAMADAGVIAVTLPIASLYLSQPPVSAHRLRAAGVRMAVATDFNPGSAPSAHLPLAMLLASTLQRMTPAEVVKGVTIHAAAAIGLESEVGSIEPGKRADIVLLGATSVEEWVYHFQANAVEGVVIGGHFRKPRR